MICVFIRREETQREDGHGKMKAEPGVMLPHAEECLGPEEAGRGKEGSSLEASKGA